jgi:glycosyltransferase involved in cell wall biosynthesis
MIQNRFIVVSTCYNKGKWVGFNINSVKQQSHSNFIAIYGYDKSPDNTLEYIKDNIKDDSRFILFENPNPGCFLKNFYGCINYLKDNNLVDDEDVIVEVDGDDWLMHPFVFDYLNQVYQNPDTWMTYGQYIEYPKGNVGGHYNLELDPLIDTNNSYRTNIFPYSHLKTYKFKLLDKVPQESLINPQTGEYFTAAADFALTMPMVEMAGLKRIHRIPEPVYVYNLSEDADNESIHNIQSQKFQEQLIRQITPSKRL